MQRAATWTTAQSSALKPTSVRAPLLPTVENYHLGGREKTRQSSPVHHMGGDFGDSGTATGPPSMLTPSGPHSPCISSPWRGVAVRNPAHKSPERRMRVLLRARRWRQGAESNTLTALNTPKDAGMIQIRAQIEFVDATLMKRCYTAM